jgi:hypothetical protein
VDEDFIRGFLGKMLFSGEILKKINVLLSGGGKSTLYGEQDDAANPSLKFALLQDDLPITLIWKASPPLLMMVCLTGVVLPHMTAVYGHSGSHYY